MTTQVASYFYEVPEPNYESDLDGLTGRGQEADLDLYKWFQEEFDRQAFTHTEGGYMQADFYDSDPNSVVNRLRAVLKAAEEYDKVACECKEFRNRVAKMEKEKRKLKNKEASNDKTN